MPKKYAQVFEGKVVAIAESPNDMVEVQTIDDRMLGVHYVDGQFFGYSIRLTADKSEIIADGVDTATITATVYTWDEQAAMDFADSILFDVNGQEVEVPPVDGVATLVVDSAEPGVFTIKTVNGGYVIQNGSVEVDANVQEQE